MTRPSFEMNEPEHPPASRTEARMTLAVQASSGVKPYFFCSSFFGRLSRVYMPSAAKAAEADSMTAHNAMTNLMTLPFFGLTFPAARRPLMGRDALRPCVDHA